jgi:hypothetical protein
VRAPKRAKRVRVRYSVTAQDAVDGSLPAVCTPRSGTFFRVGRTKVKLHGGGFEPERCDGDLHGHREATPLTALYLFAAALQ